MANHPPPPPPAIEADPGATDPVARRLFFRRAALFVAIGAVLYLALFGWSEALARGHADKNRFHQILSTEPTDFDYVVLGASHAAVLDYREMNQRLEQAVGGRVMNLAEVGSGITLNRFLLDLFLSRHSTRAVVYVVDSFVFYSEEWNEMRIADVELYRRAPWSPGLAGRMIADSDARGAVLDYLTGFSKINNADRFEEDVFDAEISTFDRTYRPIPQIDRQRMEFLYPEGATDQRLDQLPYLDRFRQLGASLEAEGIEFIIVRPPIPPRIEEMLPNEENFVQRLEAMTEEEGFDLLDFSGVVNDREYFYDSDHLNQDGAIRFIDEALGPALQALSMGGR